MFEDDKLAGMLRLIGVMAVGVALAWALQILGFGNAGAALSRVTWTLGAASIAGAGVGLIVCSSRLPARARS